MKTIGLLFKVLWAPGEAMFLLSKNPRVLTPLVFLWLFGTIMGGAVMMKVDSAELAMRAIEKSTRGASRQTNKRPKYGGK